MKKKFSCLYLFSFFALLGISLADQSFELLDVETLNQKSRVGKVNSPIVGEMSIIRSLPDGANLLCISLRNTAKKNHQLSRLLLSEGVSYYMFYQGEEVPSPMINHHMIPVVEQVRAEHNNRWLDLKPEQKILIVIDPSKWSIMANVKSEDREFSVVIEPELFESRPVKLRFRRITSSGPAKALE